MNCCGPIHVRLLWIDELINNTSDNEQLYFERYSWTRLHQQTCARGLRTTSTSRYFGALEDLSHQC